MVMVTKNQKPAKKVARKGDQITDANGAQSGNRKDLKCVRLWSVVCGLWSVVRIN